MASRGRFTRGLRFRLTAGYALFFALLLTGMAALFRERLASTLHAQTREVLEQEWGALKGYLRIQNDRPHWYFDPYDPDEAFIVERLRRVYLLADAEGRVVESSTNYRALGIDSPLEIRNALGSPQPLWRQRKAPNGPEFLIRGGVIFDEVRRRPYFVAIGRSLAENALILKRLAWVYVVSMPAMILAGCLLGWFLAGRALSPVTDVARAAARISGSNLSLRIPTRDAGDELDYLITTFNQMIQRLETSFQQIRQFSTDVSHELRTPITAARGQLEVALLTARNQEQYREAILNALEDLERLSQIVRALLLLSQAESGQLALQKSQLDLCQVVQRVAEQFQIPAEEAGIRLLVEAPESCPAELDRLQVERLLSNLLSNAVKYTPRGGEVWLRLRLKGERVEIAVEDDGPGIAPEHVPHIFDRFYRVPGRAPAGGPEKGLGLGLSFVAWIVKAHGGDITVDSNRGRGTQFVVTLPTGAKADRHAYLFTGLRSR